MRRRCIALLFVLPVLATASGVEIYVDADAARPRRGRHPVEDGSARRPFDRIQEAIDVAEDGDTIIVAPGHYLSSDPWEYDEIDFKGKTIRLISSAPTDFNVAEQTVLCGVVVFQGTEGPDCLLQGFKIQNHGHGGILGNGTQATVSHCIISGNGPCGATVVKDVHGTLRNCLIVDNLTFQNCGVLPVVSGCHQIIHCTIANNLSGLGLTNEGLPEGGRIRVRNSILFGNLGLDLVHEHVPSPSTRPGLIEYCLIGQWASRGSWPELRLLGIQSGDPCFVQPGLWIDDRLIEGDYHLKSEGWRWSRQEIHGSHWYFDPSTSPAIDAGDPMDLLGQELERVPDDPEGRWGFNHAVNLGAYGGTGQASLAPTVGEAPGVGAVDLQDYWPWDVPVEWHADSQYLMKGGERRPDPDEDTSMFLVGDDRQRGSIHLVYVDHVLYLSDRAHFAEPSPDLSGLEVLYPQYLTVGDTVQTPENPLFSGPQGSPGQAVTVVRGTLAEVVAGTDLDPNQFATTRVIEDPLENEFVSGERLDVIALRAENADGSLGRPLAIFARGFGPLLLGGEPVDDARVGERRFVAPASVIETPSGPRIREEALSIEQR
mgnify:FL=1